MTEITQEATPSISEMLRITSKNNHELLIRIADRIDEMQDIIEKLEARILELESAQDDTE